ncbi:tetratricopeptide repeat protein [Nostoc sp. WHI]|uniref:tetratricopeptide repeat protein n=1 Tax=Nostoc sp. WHI TaxID=2650611 RepID=UPI0018C53357|nr:tetratricopeptide repeat protein [Nostoc sp. WHI]MBG1268236.1 tetratricopeptide repeat protein [Nostoc sp. WHI]
MNKAENVIEEYRTQVEQLVYKYYEILDGNLTDNARHQLTEYQKLLGISLEQATLIEFQILKHCQNYDQKIQSYKQLLNKNIQVHGHISFKGHNFLNKFQQRLELDNDGVAVAYASLGNDLKNEGEFEAALILFQEAINLDYNCAVAYTGQGYIFYEQGKHNKAIKSFLKARELFDSQDMLQEVEQIQIILSYLQNNHGLWNNILLIIKNLCLPKRKKRISASTTQDISNNDVYKGQKFFIQSLTIEDKSVSETFNNDMSKAKIANFANKIQDNGRQQANQYIYELEQKQILAEAAADIQKLLKQLEATNPNISEVEKLTVVAKASEEIKNNPTLKARVINALKAGGTEAFKEAVDHLLINILVATIEGWQEV